MVKVVPNSQSKRGHLKLAGIQEATRRRYRKAFCSFCSFSESRWGRVPEIGLELDTWLSEYVYELYQRGEPRQAGLDVVAAVRRFLPRLALHTRTAGKYNVNWMRIAVVNRAIPISIELVTAVAAAACLKVILVSLPLRSHLSWVCYALQK